jgi:hypothetical protein
VWVYLGALLLVLTPLLLGASALKRQLERADQRTRARFGTGASAPTGQRLLQQLSDAHVDIASYLLVVSLAFLYPVGVLKLEQLLTGAEGNILVPVGFGAAVLVWSAYRLHERLRAVAHLRTGLATQLEVGSHVDALMHQGYYVFHEVPADGFHLDHIAVGRNGVFVIATGERPPPKGTGPKRCVEFDSGRLIYPDGEDTALIVEARGRSVWLGTWLARRLGRTCHPTPVLCLPGWHVELKTTPSFPILNQKYLGWTIPGWQGEALNEAEVQQVCTLLAEHCRGAAPEPLAEAA